MLFNGKEYTFKNSYPSEYKAMEMARLLQREDWKVKIKQSKSRRFDLYVRRG